MLESVKGISVIISVLLLLLAHHLALRVRTTHPQAAHGKSLSSLKVSNPARQGASPNAVLSI